MKVNVSSIFILCLILLVQPVFSQKIDSLKLVLKESKQDTTLVKTYIELSEICDFQEILNYTDPAIKLCSLNLEKQISSHSLKVFYSKYLALAFNNSGYY